MGEEKLSQIGSEIPTVLRESDRKSRKEQAALFGDKWRAHQKKQVIHYLFIVAMWVVVFVVLGLFVCRALQAVLPSSKCWLTDEQVKYIDGFVSHGAIGGLLVLFGKKILRSHIDSDNDEKGEDVE